MTVAQNAHRDRRRRVRRTESHGDAADVLAQLSPWARIAVAEPEVLRGFEDELLRLLFACCHPALEDGESAALALATVIGLSNDEIAHSLTCMNRSPSACQTRSAGASMMMSFRSSIPSDLRPRPELRASRAGKRRVTSRHAIHRTALERSVPTRGFPSVSPPRGGFRAVRRSRSWRGALPNVSIRSARRSSCREHRGPRGEKRLRRGLAGGAAPRRRCAPCSRPPSRARRA